MERSTWTPGRAARSPTHDAGVARIGAGRDASRVDPHWSPVGTSRAEVFMSIYEDRVRMGRELQALATTWTESIPFEKALKEIGRKHNERDDFEWGHDGGRRPGAHRLLGVPGRVRVMACPVHRDDARLPARGA